MELKGDKFILREWRMGDAASLQKHADNPNISRYLLSRFPSPYTLRDATEWVTMWQGQSPVINFAICKNGEVIGCVGLELREDVYAKTAILGYWLSEAHWGSGIMTSAVKLITNYAFIQLKLLRIQAGVFATNPASMRVLEKADYVKEGILRKSIIKNGQIIDEHMYAAINTTIADY